jgi:multiple sugar transport system permease protein
MKRTIPFTLFLYALLLVLSGWYVVPFCWALVTSVKHPGMVFDGRWLPYARAKTLNVGGRVVEAQVLQELGDSLVVTLGGTSGQRVVPRAALESVSPAWDNYADAIRIVPFGKYFLNSTLVSLCITLGQLITCSLGGYAFSRLQFPGRDAVFLLYLATLMIPGPILTVPVYMLLRQYHLLNTYQGVILPGLFSAYGTFLLKQFFQTIPKDLEDAARIDGAGAVSLYFRIILPLSGPALAALATFVFIGSWHDFFWPSIVLTDPGMLTLPVGLAHFNDIYMFEYGRLMAGCMISVAPAVLMYMVFQRFITRGVVMTGLKG